MRAMLLTTEPFSKHRQTPNAMSQDEKAKLAQLMQTLTVNAIETPIRVMKEKIASESRQEVVNKLNALYTEVIKLQYRLREYATVEWYDTLDERRRRLHDVFEENRDFFKDGSKGKNWLFLTDVSPQRIKVDTMEHDGHEYFFAFFGETAQLETSLNGMRTREANKCLCVPLFHVET